MAPWTRPPLEIKVHEAWWTILLGTALVLEGSKNLVRWTQGLPPLPVFGAEADGGAFLMLSVLGILNMIAGLLVLRCRPIGPLLGLCASALELLSIAVSWPRLDDWLARRVEARRALQGREVGADEIEFMQGIYPTGVIAGLIVATVWLILTYVRLRRTNGRH